MKDVLRAAALGSVCCLALSGCLAAAAGAGAGAGFVAADNANASREEKASRSQGTAGSTASAGVPSGIATTGMPDRMSAERMIGQTVMSADGQRIGDIKDIILDRDGRARDAVLDASGGDLAVPLSALRRAANATDQWVAANLSAEQARLMARYSYDPDTVSLRRK